MALSSPALAAGFGKAQLKSQLGQPLNAEVEISGDDGDQLSDRCFKIIKPHDRDVEPEDIVRGNVSLGRNAKDHRVLRISSNSPVNEPIINITLEMSCGNNPFIRRYTFLPEVPSRKELAGDITPAETSAPTPLAAGTPAATLPEPSSSTAPTKSTRPRRERPTAEAGNNPPLAAANAAATGSAPAQLSQLDPGAKLSPKKPSSRRRGEDRLSLGTIAALRPEQNDAPLVLKISSSLGLPTQPDREMTPAQEALLNLERRLGERANEMSLGNYDTKVRLRELIEALEEARTIARQLPEGLELPVAAPAPVPGSVIAATPPPAPPPPPEEPSRQFQPTELLPSGTVLYGGLALLLASIGGIWLARKQWQSSEPASLSAPLAEQTIVAEEAPRLNLGNNPASSSTNDPDTLEIDDPRETKNAISVSHGFEEEFDDRFSAHLEAAEIMICFGRYQSAAAEVAEFILENPTCGLRPRLALLDIYRRGNMKSEFDKLAEGLVGKFNIAPPSMITSATAAADENNLDHFPHIVAKISMLWGSPDCLGYIRHLTTDTRGGTRTGFDIEAADELALLESILELRIEAKPVETSGLALA